LDPPGRLLDPPLGPALDYVSRPARLKGFPYCGPHRYFLTICTRSRQSTFDNLNDVRTTLNQFSRTAKDEAFAILAYCLMPDHAHFLIEGTSDQADFCRFTKLAKQRSGAAHALLHGRPLWQKGFYEHVLRVEEDAKNVAKYILENPVRAGLVSRADEYPYSGSEVWTMAELLNADM
jgi:putative transposase